MPTLLPTLEFDNDSWHLYVGALTHLNVKQPQPESYRYRTVNAVLAEHS